MPSTRRPRFRRDPTSPPLLLQERDLSLLSILQQLRVAQSHHLTQLIPGSEQHLLRRLARLYHHGYLDRPTKPIYLADRSQTFIYSLTIKGLKALSQGSVRNPPKLSRSHAPYTLEHDLAVTDVLTHLISQCEDEKLTFGFASDFLGLNSRLDWSLRLPRNDFPQQVIPDASFFLTDGKNRRFYFLELDRGTMPIQRRNPHQSSFLKKVAAYRETRSSGLLWKRHQIPNFQVLVVTTSSTRLQNLRLATLAQFQNQKTNLFQWATLDEVLSLTASELVSWPIDTDPRQLPAHSAA